MNKTNKTFKELVSKYDVDMIGYLLFDEDSTVIFSIDDSSSPLDSSLTCVYQDFTYVALYDLHCLRDLLKMIDRKSEICEIKGYDVYLGDICNDINSSLKKNTIYLPLLVEGEKQAYELKLVRFEEEEVTLGMFKILDPSSYNYERFYADSYKDQLSGLFNKNALNYHLSLTGDDHFMGFMDIDGFKRINDKFSHKAGDSIIRQIGEVLIKKVADPNVIFYRVGGDEFVFMTNHIGYEEVMQLYHKIRRSLAFIDFFDVKITLSCGLSFYDDHNKRYSIQDAVDIADYEMYISKSKGGNTISYISPNDICFLMKDKSIRDLLEDVQSSDKRLEIKNKKI